MRSHLASQFSALFDFAQIRLHNRESEGEASMPAQKSQLIDDPVEGPGAANTVIGFRGRPFEADIQPARNWPNLGERRCGSTW